MNQPKQRTHTQNAAMHLLFEHLANELNGQGLDMRVTLKPEIEIPWSADTVKEYLWRPIQKAQVRKDSSAQLSTAEVDKVFETLNRHLSQRFGLAIEFPSVEALIRKQDMQV